MRAREYFEGIRAEVVKLEQSKAMLEAMKAREGAKGGGFEPSVGGGDGDPMDAVASRIDFEGRLQMRIADAGELIDEACSLLYGGDNRGGLAKAKGTRYADAVCMAYLQAQPWAEIAEVMQCSPKWCRELCSAAFRYIDAAGFATIKEI